MRVHDIALYIHVGTITHDVDGSTDPVFTKWTCKESQITFTDDFKVGGEKQMEFGTTSA